VGVASGDPKELLEVVTIHRSEIGAGFLSSLGEKVLEMIFAAAIKSQHAFLLVGTEKSTNSVNGFLLGTTDTSAFYRDFFRMNWFRGIFIIAPKMMSLKRIRKTIETLIYPSRQKQIEMPSAELLDLAVKPESRGSGLAQKLFFEFDQQLAQKGIQEFKITTGQSLPWAHRFYEKLGAEKVKEIEIHKGERTFVYLYSRKKRNT
jgi:ribosomal protein S18 acetylase RimI-like enzyme